MFFSTEMFSFIPDESIRQHFVVGMNGGFIMATATIVLTIILELLSIPTVQAIWYKQQQGKSLYVSAVALNFLNHYIYGIAVYAVAVTCLCRYPNPNDTTIIWSTDEFQHWQFWFCTAAVMLVHAVSYYTVHKSFHTLPHLYKYHRYHHRFNTNVPPMSANAVSGVEYLLAYIMPFALAAVLVHPTVLELATAVMIISVCNLLIHTPVLEEFSFKYMPAWLVTTHGHGQHHKRLTLNYAAPTINLDYFVELVGNSSIFDAWIKTEQQEGNTTNSGATTVAA